MKKLRSVNKYFLKYKWRLLLGVVFVAISSKFAVMPGNVIKDILDNVKLMVDNGAGKDAVMQLVFKAGIMLLGLALLRGLFMFMMRQTIIVMSRHIEYDQKNEIYNQYQRLNTSFYKSNFTGDLMNRISEDVSRVRMYTGPSIMYFTNAVGITIFSFIEMWKVNHKLTLYVLAPLPLLTLSIYYVNRIIFKKSSKIQRQLSALTTTAQETYSGIRVIKSFVQEGNMLRFFNKTSEDYRESTINLSVTEAVYFPSMNLFIGLSLLCTVLIGGYFAISGAISTGEIAKFVFYINQLMFPISSIGMVASMVQRAGASQQRIDEFLQQEPEIRSTLNATNIEVRGNVTFDHVTFTYPHTGITAVKDLSLSIDAGQKIAILGNTGSGKSTLAHLLLRMYDTTSGQVLVDGKNVKQLELESFRQQIAYSPQEPYLFSDTIYNNICFGKNDATEEEVMRAAKMAQLHAEVEKMPEGYKTVVGERGVTLSGGQKQRLALARALVKNSPILVLDGCLSAVDTQTEMAILDSLSEALEGKTAIVITHRIFTSWTFDQVVVMDDGQIAEQGTHEQLMTLNNRYAQLYRHQTS